MSKKFTYAQQHYAVHELETLAILEALLKWEDKLIGRKVHVITDHKALEFFKTQARLSNRQRRWIDYMSKFEFDITYIKGELNKVADCLSRYFENDTSSDIHELHEYVQADRRIDPDGEDLPRERYQEVVEKTVEIRIMQVVEARHSQRLREAREQREQEAEEMHDADIERDEIHVQPLANDQGIEITLEEILRSRNGNARALHGENSSENARLLRDIKKGYANDKLFNLIKEDVARYPSFNMKDDTLWTRNAHDKEVICIPRDRKIITRILDKAHSILGHFGDERTCEYVRRWYWWPSMVKDTQTFCRTCELCQQAKGSNQMTMGKLHPLPIPTKPWDSIGMDFIGPFPEVKGYNYLWVVICRMTSMVHLVPVHTTMTAKELSWKYLREIVRLHGLPSSIVSDRDSKFTSQWWKELHRTLGAKLLMSTSFHPQTDGQTERMNKNIGQILRTSIRSDQKDWIDRIDLTEFAINSSVSASSRYAPFELNGGYMPSMLKEFRSNEITARGIKDFAEQALRNLAKAHDAIIETRAFQTRQSNKHRREEPEIAENDLVYLSTKNLNLPKNRARKLCPKFIGPYRVAEARPETSNYVLELPTALVERRIVPTFHISLLRPYNASSDALFPDRTRPEPYDFGAPDEHEWFVDEIVGHRWTGPRTVQYEVRWSMGDTTWETHTNCSQLAALDRYLELQGVANHLLLSKRNT